MATKRDRATLQPWFNEGEKPLQSHFHDLIESYVNIEDDTLNKDLEVGQGLKLGNSTASEAGTIRWNGIAFEGHDGVSWKPLGGGGGTSSPWDVDGGSIIYAGGQVGINIEPSKYLLEVASGSDELVQMGHSILGSNPNRTGDAWFSHSSRTEPTEYALIQQANGRTVLNSAADPMILAVNGAAVAFIGASELRVAGDIIADGTISDSDISLKKNVKDFNHGMSKLRQIKPKRFEFNGKAGTQKGKKGIGLIAQEVEQIIPEMVCTVKRYVDGKHQENKAINMAPLVQTLVNAVKELDTRISKLERGR